MISFANYNFGALQCLSQFHINAIRIAQLSPLKAMENPADYDIDKDMGDEEVDENKIGNMSNHVLQLYKTQII